jgi:alkyl hydroperoxide reductase subunit AhpC
VISFGIAIALYTGFADFSHCDWKTRLAGVEDGKATKYEILADPKLVLYNECGKQPADKTITLGRFNISTSRNPDDVRTSHSRTGELTPEQIRLVERCRPGDKLWVDEILVDCPDGTYRKLSPIIIIIE